jgi:hypothetical protein
MLQKKGFLGKKGILQASKTQHFKNFPASPTFAAPFGKF